MDGHRDERVAPPTGLMEALRARHPVDLALRTLGDLHNLQPVHVPELPILSEALAKLMERPQDVPKDLKEEHVAYCRAIDARASAKAENRRRLRSSLWVEQCLREHKRPEYRRVRALNMEAWGVQEPASVEPSEREQQVRAYA